MTPLRSSLIRLASKHPELRVHLLPLLKSASALPKFRDAEFADAAVSRWVYKDPMDEPSLKKPNTIPEWEECYQRILDHAKEGIKLHETAWNKYKAALSELRKADPKAILDEYGDKNIDNVITFKINDHHRGAHALLDTVDTYEKAQAFLKKYGQPSIVYPWTNLDHR